VLERTLYPRAITGDTTGADRQVYHDEAHEQGRTTDMKVGVGSHRDSGREAQAEVEATEPRPPMRAHDT
jgi:hypothetical protein